jgi:hypothetical protein
MAEGFVESSFDFFRKIYIQARQSNEQQSNGQPLFTRVALL